MANNDSLFSENMSGNDGMSNPEFGIRSDARANFDKTKDMWKSKSDLGEHDYSDVERFRLQRQKEGKNPQRQ